MFRAVLVERDAAGATSASVQDLAEDRLPAGDVTVAVEYSTVNYKDGLCLGAGGGLVRAWPHVPGIDFAGRVQSSSDPRYKPGDAVILTGWRVGETHWGGYATLARVKADWLVPLPAGLTTRAAMAIGTAGLTSMLAVMALEPAWADALCRAGVGHRGGGRGRVRRCGLCWPVWAMRLPPSPAGQRRSLTCAIWGPPALSPAPTWPKW